MIASTIPFQFNVKPPYYLHQTNPLNAYIELASTSSTTPLKPPKPRSGYPQLPSFIATHLQFQSCPVRRVLTRACTDGGGGGIDATPKQESTNAVEKDHQSSSIGDSYVALFVRMLGLDNDPLDREQAIVALWKYSLGGKKCIDNIMQFEGCINLIVNLLKSDSSSCCAAASGLLRSISSVNQYRDVVAASGAVEEIAGLLTQPSLTSEVKEQSICTLWNLSADERIGAKIAHSDLLPQLIRFLEDENMKVKEAAGGVLANLSLTHSNHSIMVEGGVIPKLANFLKSDVEDDCKVIRKVAKNALVELAKDEYHRILVIEEGLVPVPLIGAAAYSSYTPALHSWPTLPDGSEIERTSKVPSRFGASELLIGLNIDEKNANMDKAKEKAIIGRSKQQFLIRSGAIEVEDAQSASTSKQFTLLPWMDGVARLVLMLELTDESAISRAAESIADASINEDMRNSFKESGAVRHLVRLLDHNNDAVRIAAIGALERLSKSNDVCRIIEAEGVVSPLITILKNPETSESTVEKALNLLTQFLDPSKEMKSKFYGGPVHRSKKGMDAVAGHDASNEFTTIESEISSSKTVTRQNDLDSTFIARLVEILKHSSPNLQRKAASVLEFVAIVDGGIDKIMLQNISSALDAIFHQEVLSEKESDVENQEPEVYALRLEEAGLAISAGSQLLTKLLDSWKFCQTINASHFTQLFRKILKSNIPLQYKAWVAACLAKLSYLYGPRLDFEDPINMELTLYETIPRLIEQMKSSFSPVAQEAAVIELNRIISEGVVDATQAVALEGGIFPLVKLIEGGSDRAVEAALSIMYNLSMDTENHSAMIAAGTVPVLRRVILAQRPQWKQALHLLRTLPV